MSIQSHLAERSIDKEVEVAATSRLENHGYLLTMVTVNIKSCEETTELPKSDLVQMFRLSGAISEDAMK